MKWKRAWLRSWCTVARNGRKLGQHAARAPQPGQLAARDRRGRALQPPDERLQVLAA